VGVQVKVGTERHIRYSRCQMMAKMDGTSIMSMGWGVKMTALMVLTGTVL